MNRTIVIGLDGATWDIINPMRDQGELPTIDKLIKNGTSGNLHSTTPPMTPLAWTSMATGVNPGKHGIFDFVSQDRETYQINPIDFSEMTRPSIWDIFNANGKKTGIVNFPLAHPPESVDGFFISGFPTPDTAGIVQPPKYQDKIDRTGFRIHPKVTKENTQKYLNEIVDLTKAQRDLSIDLAKSEDVELLWTIFMGLDWVQHYLWNEQIDGYNAVEVLYRKIDQVVGDLVTELDEYNVVIVSDHGMGPIKGEIHLNSLLNEWGYLDMEPTERQPVTHMFRSFSSTALEFGSRLPSKLKDTIQNYLPETIYDSLLRIGGAGQYDLHTKIDWESTDVFSYGAMGRVFLHHRKKYSDGTVSDEEFNKLRDDVIQKLNRLKHPVTEEELIDWAVPAENIYDGPQTDEGPDILFSTVGHEYMVYCDFGEQWIHPPQKRYADHRPEGVFIMAGEGFSKGKLDAEIEDIAPTILHEHRLPVLEGMDGNVLTGALISDQEIRYESDYANFERNKSEANRDEVKDRLEDLGYL